MHWRKVHIFLNCFPRCHSSLNEHHNYAISLKYMKIFVADQISPLGVDYLKKQEGFEVVEAYGSPPEEVIEIAKDSHAIIVRSDTQINSEVINASQKLKVIGRIRSKRNT